MTTRYITIRRKVEGTGTGTGKNWPGIYVDVSYDVAAGRAIRVDISEPGKFDDTAVGELLRNIAAAITEGLNNG